MAKAYVRKHPRRCLNAQGFHQCKCKADRERYTRGDLADLREDGYEKRLRPLNCMVFYSNFRKGVCAPNRMPVPTPSVSREVQSRETAVNISRILL